jgi:hypothetical protein
MDTPRNSRLRPGATLALAGVLVAAVTACEREARSGSPVCHRGSPTITVFQGPDGECLPRSRVVGYRCHEADPLVVLEAGSGAERRFLGGAFAVPVPKLPEGSEVVGVGDGSQLVRVPGDDRWLYTVRGASIWRWLAMPPSDEVPQEPQAFMLGDSILEGAGPDIVAALPGWTIEIDAVPGRGSVSGAGIAAARTVDDEVVVVELGTNDRVGEAFGQSAREIVSAFRDVPLVLWQNVEGPPEIVPAVDDVNAAIEAVAGSRPNVAIADWASTVPEEYLHDGVHPDAEHQDAMAGLIAPMLASWHAAATQQPGCVD